MVAILVNKIATGNTDMKITKRQLRQIIQEATNQNTWVSRLGAAIADGPHAIAELYVEFYKDDADVYFDEDRSYLRREGVQDLDLRQIDILIGKLINQLVHDRKLRKTNSLYAKEIEAIGRGLYDLEEEDIRYLDYKPVVRGGKTVSVTVIDHEGPRGYPMGRTEMNISPSDAQSAGTTLPQVVRALEQLGAKKVTRRPPRKKYTSIYD